MKNVMVDLESMGAGRNAAIIAIGAVQFDPLRCRTGHEFYRAINFADCLRRGATLDWRTIEWWAKQSPEVKRAAWTGRCSLPEALADFARFLPKYARMWSNAPGFDLRLLRESYELVGQRVPWHPAGDRDMRTVLRVFHRFGVHLTLERDESQAHNALADAQFQVRLLTAAFERLGEFVEKGRRG